MVPIIPYLHSMGNFHNERTLEVELRFLVYAERDRDRRREGKRKNKPSSFWHGVVMMKRGREGYIIVELSIK